MDTLHLRKCYQKEPWKIFFDNNKVWFRKNGIWGCDGSISRNFLLTLSYYLNSKTFSWYFCSPVKFSRVCLEIKSVKYKLSSKKAFPLKSYTCGETTMREKSFKETLTSSEAAERFLHSPAKHKRNALLSTVFNLKQTFVSKKTKVSRRFHCSC